MMNHFVCGTGTFHYDEAEYRFCASPGRKSQKKNFCRSHGKDSKKSNPYSARGLDKFSELLADLDERRQKIYSQMNPQDVSIVRFVYSNSDDVVPIVIKAKKKDKKHKEKDIKDEHVKTDSEAIPMDKSAIDQPSPVVEEIKQPKLETEKNWSSWNMSKWDTWKRPSLFLPLILIMILLLLTAFGRSAATLCICIFWYGVSTLKDSSKSTRLKKKKKDYVRGHSEKKMVIDGLLSSISTNSEALKDKPPTKHGHQKSW